MIVHPYAGPGGMSEGLRTLGHTDIGIETDPAACATRNAAGHRTMRADATTYPLDHLAGKVDGLIVTPPCQAFSTAGNGAGRGVLAELAVAIRVGDWVVCEQVPPVLSLWRTYAARWRTFGWSTWAGVLLAADFGVPQTRRRAFLIARTDGGAAVPPEPTHCEGGVQTMFGELAPWVTMAEALGWDDTAVNTRGERTTPGGNEFAAQQPSWTLDRRQQHEGEPVRLVDCDTEPAPTLTGRSQWVFREVQANGAVRSLDQPAMTISSSADNGNFRFEQWPHHRPATTVAGDPRITARCHHDEGSQGANAVTVEQAMTGDYDGTAPIKLTIRDALILQGFPPDYPVQGTRTAQFRQVGDAVPPPLAAAVIAAAIGHTHKAAT